MNSIKRPHALVVDDDPISLEVTRRRLEELGFEVDVREDSLGTSRWVLENQPDLVVLDVMMPALTGPELAAVLKRSALCVQILLQSSKPQAEVELLARSVGALGGISKELGDEAFKAAFVRLAPPTCDASASNSSKEGDDGWEETLASAGGGRGQRGLSALHASEARLARRTTEEGEHYASDRGEAS